MTARYETPIERRVRRKITTAGHVLIKTRPGSTLRKTIGLYAIADAEGRILSHGHTIEELAEQYGGADKPLQIAG